MVPRVGKGTRKNNKRPRAMSAEQNPYSVLRRIFGEWTEPARVLASLLYVNTCSGRFKNVRKSIHPSAGYPTCYIVILDGLRILCAGGGEEGGGSGGRKGKLLLHYCIWNLGIGMNQYSARGLFVPVNGTD